MEEMDKHFEFDTDTESVEALEDVAEAQVSADAEPISSEETAEAPAAEPARPEPEIYYTYGQGTPVISDDGKCAAASTPAVKDESRSKAVTALVLGIIALASSFICCLWCLPLPIILGIISLVKVSKSKKLSRDGRLSGIAIAALVCSIIAIVAYVVFLLIMGLYFLLMLSDPEGKEIINDFLANFGYELAF